MLGGSIRVDLGKHKIKMIIIIVFKLDTGVNPRQNRDHELGESTYVNLGQCKDKIYYYDSFKTQLKD
jgi:hypothetical protein